MPLVAGYTDNFTMKSGTTLSSGALTGWTDGTYGYTEWSI